MAAVNSGFHRYQLWLIAPEGFTDEALDILARKRDAVGSSRRQTELLRHLLSTPLPASEDIATEYSLTVEMGDEGEMIAARNFGEIAEKHGIAAKSGHADARHQPLRRGVDQRGRTQLESGSPRRAAFRRDVRDHNDHRHRIAGYGSLTTCFSQEAGTIRASDGWGLKLIQELMDEVSVEPTDDGTRLVMIKCLT